MMRHELHKEQLTVLPKRFETRRWGRGGNLNIALVGQSNYNVQAVGASLFTLQNSYQSNSANIFQH